MRKGEKAEVRKKADKRQGYNEKETQQERHRRREAFADIGHSPQST